MTQPTSIKKLKGTAKPCRTNDFEPEFPTGNLPDSPPWLTGPGLAEWNRISGVLQVSGVVTDMDYTTLAIYCKMWSDFCDSADGGEPFSAAMVSAMRGYAGELGLTPVSRSKVIANNGKAKGNKFNGF